MPKKVPESLVGGLGTLVVVGLNVYFWIWPWWPYFSKAEKYIVLGMFGGAGIVGAQQFWKGLQWLWYQNRG